MAGKLKRNVIRTTMETSAVSRYLNAAPHFIIIGDDETEFKDSQFFMGFEVRFGGVPTPIFGRAVDEGFRPVVYMTEEDAKRELDGLLEWYQGRYARGYGFKAHPGLCVAR